MPSRPPASELDKQIAATHRRFVKAMDGRMGDLPADTKERYFVLLSALVTRLDDPAKALRDIMGEMMTDAASFVLQEIQG